MYIDQVYNSCMNGVTRWLRNCVLWCGSIHSAGHICQANLRFSVKWSFPTGLSPIDITDIIISHTKLTGQGVVVLRSDRATAYRFHSSSEKVPHRPPANYAQVDSASPILHHQTSPSTTATMPQQLSSKDASLFRQVVRHYENKQHKKGGSGISIYYILSGLCSVKMSHDD